MTETPHPALTDAQLLRALVHLTDVNPADRASGLDAAAAAGIDSSLVEDAVGRLRRRGLVERDGGPQRLGDGRAHFGLRITPEGYRFVQGLGAIGTT